MGKAAFRKFGISGPRSILENHSRLIASFWQDDKCFRCEVVWGI